MNKLFWLIPITSLLFMTACKTTGSAEDAAAEAAKATQKPTTTEEKIVSNIPAWCLNLPSSDTALYRCGIGESSSINMSRNRAILDAKRGLADSIDSQISSRMEDFLRATGTGENEEVRQRSEVVTKNVTVEAQLIGYKEINAETQSVSNKFLHYVLLEYPIGQANQALLNQIKQDEILSTTEAADAAMAELEAEIEKKRSGS